MNKIEKGTVITLLVVIILLLSYLGYRNYINQTHPVAAYGGKYQEGFVAENKADVDQIIQKLTKIGLVYFDKDNSLKPALADKWEISEDGKTYTFFLRDGIDPKKIADIARNHNNYSDVEIETIDSNIIKFTLKEVYSPFLANCAQPIYDFGPYEIKKQDKNEIILSKKNDFVLGKPYIDEIILKVYPDYGNLFKAIDQKEVIGVGETEGEEIQGYKRYFMPLNRHLVLFLNLNRDMFLDKDIRKKIKNSEKLPSDVNVRLVTIDKKYNLDKANELKEKYDPLGLKINIEAFDMMTIQKEIIPARDYDLLLYGLDYGYDPDPYPFWHSSQMSTDGLNLSNFSNQKADLYLEEGRQTTDENSRKEKYQKFQEVLDDEVPAIFIERYVWPYAISEKVKGAYNHDGITPADRFNEVWSWYIKEKRIAN